MINHPLHKRLHPGVVFGLALVLAGMWLACQPPTRQPAPSSATPIPSSTPQHLALALPRFQFEADGNALIVEVLDDDLFHFELAPAAAGAASNLAANQPIAVSPMIAKTDYGGPTSLSQDGQGTLETSTLKAAVDTQTLCVTLTDKSRQPPVTLTTSCPKNLNLELKGLSFTPENMQAAYGLGEYFVSPGNGQVDWVGQVRRSGNALGNAMTRFSGGSTGNAQFPVLYALGSAGENYALFVDSLYKQEWDFRESPWEVELRGDQIRWYVLGGPDLLDLRQDFLELTGRPPVPPRKTFGLWISEYGYDNWDELEDKLRTLRENHFPVDGFVMDLQWFGGIEPTGDTRMGTLTWDTTAFPDPPGKIADLQQRGVGLMVIEESYVGQALPEFGALSEQGFLVADCEACPPAIFAEWWGTGGMLDWSNPAAGDYWHDAKRQPLIEMGIIGHWTDLGEPEMFDATGWYYGFPESGQHDPRAVHNSYNLRWSESIARGYARNNISQRPFILSRSGTAGIQRYGAALWSGDIGADWNSLAAQFNAQVHVSFSGIDYFGSDIGGFHRGPTQGESLDQIYTQWFAASALLDLPVRVHTENLCNCKETAPDRVGDQASNLANIRLRYELIPYLYSLAHRAYLFGEPTVAPLVLYYQTDPNVWQIGAEKMLGRDILIAALSKKNATTLDVYLPAGTWVDFYTHEVIASSGEWRRAVPLMRAGLFRLPIFVRSGAILPMMAVDEQTLNTLGQRADGSRRDELIIQIYPDRAASSFTLYEDDGQTTAYQRGEVQTTLMTQAWEANTITVTLAAAQGTYAGAPTQRDNVIRLVIPEQTIVSVTLAGEALPQLLDQAAFAAAERGWLDAGQGMILAKSGTLDVSAAKILAFTLKP